MLNFFSGKYEREAIPVKIRSDIKLGAFSKTGMRSRLQQIGDWESLANQSCYSGPALAGLCGVSLRHLQRHIHSTYDQTLGGWLTGLRLEHGYQRLQQGCSVKETAFSLGYKQVSHFQLSPSGVLFATGADPQKKQ